MRPGPECTRRRTFRSPPDLADPRGALLAMHVASAAITLQLTQIGGPDEPIQGPQADGGASIGGAPRPPGPGGFPSRPLRRTRGTAHRAQDDLCLSVTTL